MNKKPIQFTILAILQFLTPLFNLVVGSLSYHVTPMMWLKQMAASGPTTIVQCMMLGPLMGLAILAVRRWSYPIIMLCAVWAFAANTMAWYAHPKMIPLLSLVGVNLLPALLVTYFLLPSVRAVYFYPIIRWWEVKPRYQYSTKVSFSFQKHKVSGLSLNVSEGGMFLETTKKLALGKVLMLDFALEDRSFQLASRPVFQSTGPKKGFGLQFTHTPESRKALGRSVRLLENQGVPRIPERRSVTTEMTALMKEVIQGRQLVPTLSPIAVERLHEKT